MMRKVPQPFSSFRMVSGDAIALDAIYRRYHYVLPNFAWEVTQYKHFKVQEIAEAFNNHKQF